MTSTMKVLVAKRPTPPRQHHDAWSAIREEIVVAPFVCPDHDCICTRVHQGIVSHGYSTKAEVRDVDTTSEALVSACRFHLDFSQWAAVVEDPAELELLAADLIDTMVQTASQHPTGTVLHMTFDRPTSTWLYTTVTT
ncbi:DUF7715 family protein [Mycolicibacterium anyangense]